jgi:hypothetical protein
MNRIAGTMALVCLTLPTWAGAQSGKLDLPDFKSLAREATDSVNISLGPWLLHMAAGFIDDKDADAAATKKLLAGIQSIDVRSYEFAKDFAYSGDELADVRRQLAQPGWNALAQVHDRAKNEDVDIFVRTEKDHTAGFALIASQPREVTIVNIVGSIKLEDLAKLQTQLHLPKIAPSMTEPGERTEPAPQPAGPAGAQASAVSATL